MNKIKHLKKQLNADVFFCQKLENDYVIGINRMAAFHVVTPEMIEQECFIELIKEMLSEDVRILESSLLLAKKKLETL